MPPTIAPRLRHAGAIPQATMKTWLRIAGSIDSANNAIAGIVRWAVLANAVLIAGNAVSRKLFSVTAPVIYDLQWHFLAAVVLLMAGYTLKRDEHVRVDLSRPSAGRARHGPAGSRRNCSGVAPSLYVDGLGDHAGAVAFDRSWRDAGHCRRASAICPHGSSGASFRPDSFCWRLKELLKRFVASPAYKGLSGGRCVAGN